MAGVTEDLAPAIYLPQRARSGQAIEASDAHSYIVVQGCEYAQCRTALKCRLVVAHMRVWVMATFVQGFLLGWYVRATLSLALNTIL